MALLEGETHEYCNGFPRGIRPENATEWVKLVVSLVGQLPPCDDVGQAGGDHKAGDIQNQRVRVEGGMKLQLSLSLSLFPTFSLSLSLSLSLSVLHVTQMDSFNLIVISAVAMSVGEGGEDDEECVARRGESRGKDGAAAAAAHAFRNLDGDLREF